MKVILMKIVLVALMCILILGPIFLTVGPLIIFRSPYFLFFLILCVICWPIAFNILEDLWGALYGYKNKI